MDQEFRVNRHTELWVQQNKRVSRAVLGGLIFAAFVFLQVLQPYQDSLDERVSALTTLQNTEESMKEVEDTKKQFEDFQALLTGVQQTINEERWTDEILGFRAEILALQARGEGTFESYQSRADQAVANIGSEQRALVDPLSQFLMNNTEIAQQMPRLSDELDAVPNAIDKWIQWNQDTVWYYTLDQKMGTAEQLGKDLHDELNSVAEAIAEEQGLIGERIEQITAEIGHLEGKVTQLNSEVAKLQQKMEVILPEWIKGLITVEQMIQLYPLIMVGLAAYLLISGLTLTSHYRTATLGHGWSSDEKSDPAFSSLWTLIYRGRIGTVLTVGTYLAVFIVIWIFFEEGAGVFTEWNAASSAGMLGEENPPPTHWIPRGLLTISTLLADSSRPTHWLARVLLAAMIVGAVIRPLNEARSSPHSARS